MRGRRGKYTPGVKNLAPLTAFVLVTLAQAQPASTNSPFVADGQKRTLAEWARKGLMQSPVAICLDWKGNLYVAESERAGNAVSDTRNIGHLNAVEEDLKFKSVADRQAQIDGWLAKGAFPKDFFTKTEDRVRIVRDTDGDGKADWSGVYAGGFNHPLDGIGAGVLWHEGSLYYTCIPNLWKLPAAKDGVTAASRESLSYGYGVRWCFYGHDLHGLVLGPDGRLYFSMGDRGYNLTTKEGVNLYGPDRGAVFRCWPDGTELERFHDGLRNPQCLAFDEYGDLFTGDNNCDSGDRARVVYVAEQGDSGWRQDVQSLPSRGPWNRESIWRTLEVTPGKTASGGVGAVDRPACFLPPVSYMGDGPSGLRAYPGTGESHEYDGHLFMVDFYGSGAKIHAFKPEAVGAGYKLARTVEYYKGVTVTDIAWGYDGRLYMADWGGGWSPNLNGVVLTSKNDSVFADKAEADAIAEVQKLFAEGFASRSESDLAALLGHRDSRVRLAAQHELAKRDVNAAAGWMRGIALDAKAPRLKRIHAIWGMGNLARRQREVALALTPLASDPDAEIRAQAMRTLGDLKFDAKVTPTSMYVAGLADPSPRVQREAAIAIGKCGYGPALPQVVAMVVKAADMDPVLRSAGAYALSRIASPDELMAAVKGLPPAGRLGAVLALRRSGSDKVAAYLADEDPAVVSEAARAVYDNRIAAGMTELANMVNAPAAKLAGLRHDGFLRRAIEANVLLGAGANAHHLLAFASRADMPAEYRGLALERLQGWDKPLKREGVWGNWVDLPARPESDVRGVVRDGIAAVLSGTDGDLLAKAKQLEARFALAQDDLESRLADNTRNSDERLTLLDELERLDSARAIAASEKILNDPDVTHIATGLLRSRAEEILAQGKPEAAAAYLTEAVSRGEMRDRQRSVKLLGGLDVPKAKETLTALAQALKDNQLDSELSLDVYDAAMALAADEPAHRIVEPLGKAGNRPAGYATELLRVGGDPDRGRELFMVHGAAECLRCHTVDGVGGNAGPNLSAVGSRLAPSRIVLAMIEPGAEIAPGYGSVSAMPPMAPLLKPAEVRDIVSFLSTLRTPEASAAPVSHAAAGPEESLEKYLLVPGVAMLLMCVWPAMRRRM